MVSTGTIAAIYSHETPEPASHSRGARRRRVLFVVHYPTYGGPHNQAARLAGPLAEVGWDLVTLLPEEPGSAVERLRQAGAEVVQLPLSRVRATLAPQQHLRFAAAMIAETASVRRLIRALRIDVVMTAGLTNPQGALAARLENIPLIWQLVDTRAPSLLTRLMMPFVIRMSNVIMSTGRTVAAMHPGAMSIGPRLVPFYPPVDLHTFQPDTRVRAQVRERLHFGSDDIVIGTVANINPQKDHLTFIRAAARVARDNSNARFLILGARYPNHSQYLDEVLRVGAQAGIVLNRNLTICDPGSEVHRLAQALDVFWMTSARRSEGIPTAVEEAMALGLPVVATDVGGIREVVSDSITGCIVSPGDYYSLADATVALLKNDWRRKEFGRAGLHRAVAEFGVECCLRDHVHALDLAVEHHTAHAPRKRGSK